MPRRLLVFALALGLAGPTWAPVVAAAPRPFEYPDAQWGLYSPPPLQASASSAAPARPSFEQLAAQIRDAATAKGWKPTLRPLVRLRDNGVPEVVELRLADALYPNARIVRVNNEAAIDGNGAMVVQTYDDGQPDTWEGAVWWTDGSMTGGSLQQIRFNLDAFNNSIADNIWYDEALDVTYAQTVFWQQTGPDQPPGPPGVALKRARPAPDWNAVWKCIGKSCFATGIAALIFSFWIPPARIFVPGCTAQAINCALGQIWDVLDPPKPPGSCQPDWLGRIRC
jgi:hypothetical protein